VPLRDEYTHACGIAAEDLAVRGLQMLSQHPELLRRPERQTVAV
jgi:hypothetical protein